MTISPSRSQPSARYIISLIACIIIGLVLLIAGTGKLIGIGQMPGQTEFLDRFIPDFLLTPESAQFIGLIFIPYILPIVETALAILLFMGMWPRLAAIIVVPLTLGFMANNTWTISQGIDKYPDCVCFGAWETLTGARFTPTQSLYIDIVLFVLAVIVIFVHPGRFFSSQFWFAKKSTNDRS
ncbi:MAG: DoxX family membrane protein [Chloroflexi bacterium]|nr:DoxX family membrane protein [Chloroflexota bacterium]